MSIVFEDVAYTYSKGTPMEKTAIRDLSLSISDGEFVVLLGPAGSGKSTFLQLLAGLVRATSGNVRVNGRVGLVFQFPEKQFFEETVYADLSFPLRRAGIAEKEIEVRVMHALSLVDMKFHDCKDRAPLELSSGEKRRVAIAAILVLDPSVIALDEPFAGLDHKGKSDIFYELKRLQKATGKTVIIATQYLEAVSEGYDRVILLEHGSHIESGVADPAASLFSPISSLANRLKSKGLDIGDDICDAGEAFLRIKRAAGERKKFFQIGLVCQNVNC